MKRYPYKSKNPECSWARSIRLFLIITHYGIYRQQGVRRKSSCSESIHVETGAVLCPLLLGLRLPPCQCSCFQISLPSLYHHHGAQWWYVHFRVFSLFLKKTDDSLLSFFFDEPQPFSPIGLVSHPESIFFCITVIDLNMPYNRFSNPFPTRALLSDICFMLK